MEGVLKKVEKIEIRMYKLGTGDCFILKFILSDNSCFTIMIDGGTWSGSKKSLTPYVENLKAYVDNKLDLLIITHEHKDHVYVFEVCEELFLNDLTIDQVWLGWSENESEKKVSNWKKTYGDKKMALGSAVAKLNAIQKDPDHQAFLDSSISGAAMAATEKAFTETLNDFAELHFEAKEGEYIGPLKGMKVIKEQIIKDNVRYLQSGEVIQGLENLPGISFYILGPPNLWEEVKAQEGKKEGDSYKHNKEISKLDAFAAALNSLGTSGNKNLPFDSKYNVSKESYPLLSQYDGTNNNWRKIEYDWLNASGTLALRMNSLTNNLSLAFAIEFEETGKVLLFPGDAEWGSWDSWHRIPWKRKGKDGKTHLTADLLNRTIFYKVAHHLSHNGTALNQGMKHMLNPDLVAMATLDYSVISSGWKSTMPNENLIKDLLEQTKGRLIIMNETDLFADAKKTVSLSQRIQEAKQKMSKKENEEFKKAVNEESLYIQYTIKL